MRTNLDSFMDVYTSALANAVTAHPNEYGYPVTDVPMVAAKMRAAIIRRSYNKDGYAFKVTCKALGIKHTYTAINAFVSEGK